MIPDGAGTGRITLRVDDDLRGVVLLGLVEAQAVRVEPAAPPLQEETALWCRRLARDLAGRAPAEIDALRPARELYRAFGIDPTKTRPSSEALLRRVLAGKPLPRISNAVDLCNLLALQFLLPMGLYDTAKIGANVTLRRGVAGETYAGIRKQDVRLEGRPVLADDRGPFGNPTSDSLRSSVDSGTESLWLVIFAPASFATDLLGAHVESARGAIARHLGRPGTPVRSSGDRLGPYSQ